MLSGKGVLSYETTVPVDETLAGLFLGWSVARTGASVSSNSFMG